MVVAMITVTFHNGFTSSAAGSGYELNIAMAALAAVVALSGPGRLSLEAASPSVARWFASTPSAH